MSYDGRGDASMWLARSADRPSLGRARAVALGSATAGRFGLVEYEVPPRSPGAQPHLHRTFAESFYVLAGRLTLYDGHSWAAASPGDYAYVPEGGVHGFRNDGDSPATTLILFAPGIPRERFFREMTELRASGRELSSEEWADFYARHDQYMVEPTG